MNDMASLWGNWLYYAILLLMLVAIIGYVAWRNVRSDGGLRTALHAISSIAMAVFTCELAIWFLPDWLINTINSSVFWRMVFMSALFPLGGYLLLLCAELTDWMEGRVRSLQKRLRERRQFLRWASLHSRSAEAAQQSLLKEQERLKG